MKNAFSHAPAYIQKLKHVEQLIVEKNLPTAVFELNKLAISSSHDPRLFLLGAQLALAAGNPDGALKAARQAHDLAPDWPVGTFHLANILERRGEFSEAYSITCQAVDQTDAQGITDAILLRSAASTAIECGQHRQALEWLRRTQTSDSLDPPTAYRIGLLLSEIGDHLAAIEAFDALEIGFPANASVLIARRYAALGANRLDIAIRDGEVLLAGDPDNLEHQYYLSIAHGETPLTKPASVIALHFDNVARSLDQGFADTAQHLIHEHVAHLIHQWHSDQMADVLDLGCGTGLLGAALGPIKGVLVGVDLSGGMLAYSSRRGGYDSLHHVNLLDALVATPQDLYHVITALGAIAHVGDLSSVMPNASRVLVPGGHFVFFCETSPKDAADFVLQHNYRYSYQSSYVQRLLEQAGFTNILMKDFVVGQRVGQPVTGLLVTAQKPRSTPALTVAPLSGKTARRSPKNAKPAHPSR